MKSFRIDICLRQFLETFRLPGESPVISFILEHFADRYYVSSILLILKPKFYFFWFKNFLFQYFNIFVLDCPNFFYYTSLLSDNARSVPGVGDHELKPLSIGCRVMKPTKSNFEYKLLSVYGCSYSIYFSFNDQFLNSSLSEEE